MDKNIDARQKGYAFLPCGSHRAGYFLSTSSTLFKMDLKLPLSTPFISLLLPIDDRLVETVRHMDTQMAVWIINVIVGYIILSILYGTDKFNSKAPKIIGYVFIVGCLQSFFMEFPLFISSIRPTGILFLIYEIFFLVNQGAPYLYILWDKVIPKLAKK